MPLIDSYDHASIPTGTIDVREGVARLPATHDPEPAAPMVVWRGAFGDPALASLMSSPRWPIEVLRALPPGDRWPWTVDGHDGGPSTHHPDVTRRVGAATGCQGDAPENVIASLPLRAYEARDGDIGGLEWWREAAEAHGRVALPGNALVRALLALLGQASEVGSSLFVEQISMIIAKRPAGPLATLTPALHSDLHYGPHSAAVVSLVEPGLPNQRGTIFAPTIDMASVVHLGAISVDTISTALPGVPVVATGCGDVCVYGGMVASDGSTDPRNGVPHLSPDSAGCGARLMVLMHRSRRDCAAV